MALFMLYSFMFAQAFDLNHRCSAYFRAMLNGVERQGYVSSEPRAFARFYSLGEWKGVPSPLLCLLAFTKLNNDITFALINC